MSDVSKLKIGNGTVYDIKDARALRDAPTDGYEYVRKNGQWAISSGGGGGGGGDGIIFDDDTAVVQPGGAILGNSILLENGSAYILSSEETANGFVKTSGDTMTGTLNKIADNIDWNNTPSETQYNSGIVVKEATNTHNIGIFEIGQTTDNTTFTRITNHRYKDNADIWNQLDIGINAEGAPYVWVSNPNAWLTALGLEDSGVKSLTNSSAFTGTVYYRKIGSVVYIYATIQNKSQRTSSSGDLTLVTIPSGYRPPTTSRSMIEYAGGSYFRVTINTGGTLVLSVLSGTLGATAYVRGYFCYTV